MHSQPRHHLEQPLSREPQLARGARAAAAGARERDFDEAPLELRARVGEAAAT